MPESINRYKKVLDSFTAEELRQIAQIKRFMECMSGDKEFRETIDKDPRDAGIHERLKRIGVNLSLQDITLFCKGLTTENYLQCFNDLSRDPESIPKVKEVFEKSPVVKLWIRWVRIQQKSRLNSRSMALSAVKEHPRFSSWRQRRIASAKSELGYFGNNIDHPLFALELSKGCSVRCWFCAFSTEKLSAVFEYTPENRDLWRDIVRVGVDLFGPHAGAALCYYATEPCDNPHYLDFIKDYKDISGAALCTATAAPLRDPSWFRRLITFYRKETLPWPRISVLSTSMLKGIHDAYSPEELRDIELLMQMKSALRPKAVSGRTINIDPQKLRGGLRASEGVELIPQGSIACVSGFYVNMVEKTIKLISPCQATERWPSGFRVFAEDTFKDAPDYRDKVERIIDRHMVENIVPGMRIAFRDDLTHKTKADGFSLISPNQRHHITGKPFLVPLGGLIADGSKTYGEICDDLVQTGVSPLAVSGMIKNLFDKGLLDETGL